MMYKSLAIALVAATLCAGGAEARRNEVKIRDIVWTCSGQYQRAPRAVRVGRGRGPCGCRLRVPGGCLCRHLCQSLP